MNIVDMFTKMKTTRHIAGIGSDECGICWNVEEYCNINEIYDPKQWDEILTQWCDKRDEFFQSWVHFSGSYCYPVPSTTVVDGELLTAEDEYDLGIINKVGLWEGNQLTLRLDLLDHLIKCFGELES